MEDELVICAFCKEDVYVEELLECEACEDGLCNGCVLIDFDEDRGDRYYCQECYDTETMDFYNAELMMECG